MGLNLGLFWQKWGLKLSDLLGPEPGGLGADFYDGGCPGVFSVTEILPAPWKAEPDNAYEFVYPAALHKFKPISIL